MAIGNSASTTNSSSVSNSDTSVPLTSSTNFQAATIAGEGMILMDEGNATEELAYSTGLSGSSLATPLANRGLEGGSAQPHTQGSSVKGIMTAGMWNDLIDSLVNILDQTTGALDTTKVVTPGGTQTLTNKTLTSPVLNTGASGTAVLDEDDMVSDSATKLATQQSIKAYVDAEIAGVDISVSTDGWTTSSDTWTYASASTFTITGVDRTAIYTKGTRLKFTQTTPKYAVVVSSSFGTDTTVTIAVNTSYTIANAAITSPFYSYQTPPDFPERFNFTPTLSSSGGAFTNAPTVTHCTYNVVNRGLVHYFIYLTYHGTSGGSGSTQITNLPFTLAASRHGFGAGRSYTNGWQCVVFFDTGTTLGFDKYDGTTAIANSASMAVGGFQPI
jgi:hypothetical protein